MTILAKGRYRVFEAQSSVEIARCLALRATVFPADRAAGDEYDARCRHVMIEDIRTGTAVCTFRLMPLANGAEIGASYSARYYELGKLGAFDGKMVELGRFCIHPDHRDPDILRLAWGALTRIVDDEGVEMLFGCASFQGTDAKTHADAFAFLHQRHVAPPRWLPRVKAPRVVALARALTRPLDPRRAMAAMPPLLRTYLTMGGWVSDHAVVDDEMGTMHVFTGVEIGAIPPARQRLLRAVAG
ncbi:ornithine-acyl[acyl carrier protein] N-acyltransferase [Palleronia marisminoris]|uniref:L-ornithine N(alpha)-acyltransferase n=1 Tax=Palleronia marisminoris TaxID=315423 RepID=A0A1Y5TIX4_9RHOB|nr:GNAT family N-acetyltransferase [Palleronia marisminoris]SFH38056.1 ornithine-acyl[acyl carrier protein] N-acyltransferase [Palleronia marisminoris]SLN62993.1 hypothetical protein PAM7066_03153 [Palleronia marisminoris]